MTTTPKNANMHIITDILNSEDYKEEEGKFHRTQVIIARMNDILKEKQITQTELADRMKMSQSNLNNILTGKKPNFRVETLLNFYDAVGIKFPV